MNAISVPPEATERDSACAVRARQAPRATERVHLLTGAGGGVMEAGPDAVSVELDLERVKGFVRAQLQ